MRSNIQEIDRELAEIRALIESISPVNAALQGSGDMKVQSFLSVRRRFDYSAFVVALYASYEKFTEDLVASFARVTAARRKYSSLPKKLLEKHSRKSAEIIARGRLGEGRYLGISEFSLVDNLRQCLADVTPYQLNEVAIIAHDQNLRYHEALSLVRQLGIKDLCNRLRKADALTGWFAKLSGEEKGVEVVPLATVLARLDDLVERRNQIAHRGGSPDNLLGTPEMEDMVNFVQAVCHGVFAILARDYLDDNYVKTGNCIPILQVEGPYRKGTVVVIANPKVRVFLGQAVFAITGKTRVAWGRIKQIKVNDVDVPEVLNDSESSIGLQLDFQVARNADTYLLNDADELIWAPSTIS